MNFKYNLLMIIIIIPFSILLESCKTENPTESSTENPTESSNDLIFFEHFRKVNGVLIEGKYYKGPDSENLIYYKFNAQEREIECPNMDFDVDQITMLYGSGISLDGLAGSGMMNHLYGIKQLPTTIDQIEIKSLHNSGTIIIKYKEKLLELKSNEEWIDTSSVISVQDSGKALIITEDVIKNYGIIDRKNVTR